MPTTIHSFSKINLSLAVGPRRPDGFHGLVTCYQTLALHDLVTVHAFPAERTRITLEANHPGVPRTETGDAERNTAFKMVAGALARLGLSAEVHLHIDKRLPVQGGLGAGSANAVAALLGLERELDVALPGPERLALAAEVGSDVPLFLLGGTVLGQGRGEEVYPLPDLPHMPCVVAVPEVGVSTARAFRELDARAGVAMKPTSAAEAVPFPNRTAIQEGAGLTTPPVPDRLRQLSRALSAAWTISGMKPGSQSSGLGFQSSGPTGIAHVVGDLAETTGSPADLLDGVFNPLLALVRTGMENDFEEVVFSEYPSLRSTKRDLMGSDPGSGDSGGGGALYAALSGSGSALFGLYRTQADAEAAQQRVAASGTRAIVTSTITRPEYWRTMFLDGFAATEGEAG